MALRNIVTEGDPILRKKCRVVEKVDDRIRGILDDMLETMQQQNGVGIAASQVGILKRMFIAMPQEDEIIYMINPEIKLSEGSQVGNEGCLSVPEMIGEVERPMHIIMEGLGYNGEPVTVDAEDFKAVVLCHEYDHLDGILYTDKATEVWNPAEDSEEE